MRPKKTIDVYHEDRLVIRWQDTRTKRVYHQGKRVGKDCPLTRNEIRMYVIYGSIQAVSAIRHARKCTLSEALKLLDSARKPFSIRRGRRAA